MQRVVLYEIKIVGGIQVAVLEIFVEFAVICIGAALNYGIELAA